jgi:hypothetical protein
MSMPRAFIIAIRANIGSPPCSPITISTSAAVCHSDACCSTLGSLVMKSAASRKVTSGTEDVLHCWQETHHKLDLTVRKLPPVLDGCRVTALRRLLDDFARFAASSVNRQGEYLWFPNAGHSVGQITRADVHVTPLLGYYAYS